MHQGIHCGFADCGRVIRLPMNLHTQVCKVVRLQAGMVDQLGREPTVEELVLESGLDKRTVRFCLLFEIGRVFIWFVECGHFDWARP